MRESQQTDLGKNTLYLPDGTYVDCGLVNYGLPITCATGIGDIEFAEGFGKMFRWVLYAGKKVCTAADLEEILIGLSGEDNDEEEEGDDWGIFGSPGQAHKKQDGAVISWRREGIPATGNPLTSNFVEAASEWARDHGWGEPR